MNRHYKPRLRQHNLEAAQSAMLRREITDMLGNGDVVECLGDSIAMSTLDVHTSLRNCLERKSGVNVRGQLAIRAVQAREAAEALADQKQFAKFGGGLQL